MPCRALIVGVDQVGVAFAFGVGAGFVVVAGHDDAALVRCERLDNGMAGARGVPCVTRDGDLVVDVLRGAPRFAVVVRISFHHPARMAAAARTVGAAGRTLVPAEQQQDAAVVEYDGSGVLAAVFAVVVDLDRGAPCIAVVLGAFYQQVDVAVVRRAVHAAFGEGQHGAGFRYHNGRNTEGRIAALARFVYLRGDVGLRLRLAASAAFAAARIGRFVAAAAACRGKKQRGEYPSQYLYFFHGCDVFYGFGSQGRPI